jgi:hypothetical protein
MELFPRRAAGREIGFGESRGGRHQHQTDDGKKVKRVHPRLLFSEGLSQLHCTDDWERRGNASEEGLRSGNKKSLTPCGVRLFNSHDLNALNLILEKTDGLNLSKTDQG